jgi:hypothetical protein
MGVSYIQMEVKKSLFLKEIELKRSFSQRKTPILDEVSKVETGLFNLEMSLKKHYFVKKTPCRQTIYTGKCPFFVALYNCKSPFPIGKDF